jgi:hypothetical protein
MRVTVLAASSTSGPGIWPACSWTAALPVSDPKACTIDQNSGVTHTSKSACEAKPTCGGVTQPRPYQSSAFLQRRCRSPTPGLSTGISPVLSKRAYALTNSSGVDDHRYHADEGPQGSPTSGVDIYPSFVRCPIRQLSRHRSTDYRTVLARWNQQTPQATRIVLPCLS